MCIFIYMYIWYDTIYVYIQIEVIEWDLFALEYCA